MAHLPKTRIVALVFCGIFLCILPAAAIYTVSDLSGSITRGQQFTVDITGKPNTAYYAWLTRTWPLSGEPYDQPPVVVANQWHVEQDPSGGPYTIGSYQYYNGNGRTILDDVAPSSSVMPNTSYYALVTTDESGKATLAFKTSRYTALKSYSVRVENPSSVNTDTLLVQMGSATVKKGSISIEAVASRPTKEATTVVTTVPTLPETIIPTTVLTTPTLPGTETLPVTTGTKKSPIPLAVGIAAFFGAVILFAVQKRPGC